MRSNRLRAAGALQHKQLRQDRYALEPDAERPEHFRRGVLVREQDGEDGGAAEEVLDFESVLVGVVGGLVVVEHQPDDVGLGGDEDDFEGGVPEGVGGVCPEEIWGAGWLVVWGFFLVDAGLQEVVAPWVLAL
jgi:hypothetical protein